MTGVPVDDISRDVPRVIARKLRRVLWRLRMVALLRGVLAVITVAGAAVLGVVAVDATVTSISASPQMRWAMSISALCLTAWAVLRFLARPLKQAFSLAGVARMVEMRHPELQERISSAVELLTSTDAEELRGSDRLIAALAIQAARDAKALRPRREVTHRRTGPFLAASVAVALVIYAMVVLWPDRGLRLLTRAVAPFANLPNVYAEDLTIAPGDCTLMQGDRLRVEVLLAGDAHGTVEFRKLVDGDDVVREMARTETPEGDRAVPPPGPGPRRSRFVFASQPVSTNFKYRIRASDAWSKYYHVTVIPRPKISAVTVTYDYPPYTRRDSHTDRKGGGDVLALAGTKVTVQVETDSPITGAEVKLGTDSLEALVDETGRCTFSFRLDAATPPTWSIRPLRRAGGEVFAGDLTEHAVEIESDARPAVDVVVDRSRDGTLTLNRQDRPVVSYRISDDFAVSAAELLVEVDGRPLKAAPLELTPDPDGLGCSGTTVLDLPKLAAGTAQRLAFQVRARDNRPAEFGGHQEGRSELFQITFDDEASFLRVQVRIDDELLLRRILLEALKNLKAAKTDSATLRKSLARGGVLAAGDVARIDNVRTLLGEVHAPLRELIAEITGGTYGGLLDELTVINLHVGRGRALVGEAKISDHAKARADFADQADFEIGRALTLVSAILKHFHALADAVKQAEAFVGMSEEQKILAELAAQLGGPAAPGEIDVASLGPTMSEEEFGKLQDKLAGEVAAMVSQSPAAMAIMAERDAASAMSLTARARELSKKQAAIRQRTLLGDTIDKSLAALSARQRALAVQAAGRDATRPQQALMGATAGRIDARDIAAAAAAQKKIEAQLAQASRDLSTRAAAARLAEQARVLAVQQGLIAARAETLATAAAGAHASADAQAALAAKARAEAAKHRTALAPRLADLARRQQALADQAAKTPAAYATRAAAQAAARIHAGDVTHAHRLAGAAADQARAIARDLARAAAKAPATPALDMQVAAAVKAADASARAAASAAAAAKASQARAAEADRQARAAEDKAKQTAADGDKAAADAAAKAAADLRQAANAARADADDKARATADAAKAAANAAAGRKGIEARRQGERTRLAAAAKAAANAAADIATKQRALQAEARKLVAAAAPLQLALRNAAQADRARVAQLKRVAAAAKQLAPLAALQQKATQAALALTKTAAAAPGGPQRAAARIDTAGAMKQAAAAISAGKPDQAAKAARAAAGLSDKQAKALAAAAGLDDKTPKASVLSAEAKYAELIAARQAELRKLAEGLLAQRRKLVAEELARISASQEELFMRAADLASSVAAGWPQDDRLQTKAAQAARDASESLDAGRLDQAATQARQAARQLAELARRLGTSDNEQPPTGKTPPAAAAVPNEATAAALDAPRRRRAGLKLAEAARDLARQQANLAQQARALAAGRPLGLFTARQGGLARDIAELADDAELLSDHAEELGLVEAEATLADTAARLIDDAAHRAAATAGKLDRIAAQGVYKPPAKPVKPPVPRPAAAAAAQQAQVSASLDKAAEKLAELGKLIGDRAEPGGEQPEPLDPEDLADAYDAAAEAAETRDPSDAERASKLLSGLAAAALEMAQSLGADVRLAGLVMSRGPMRPGDPAWPGGPMGRRKARWVSRARLRMGELGVSTDVWARLSGRLRNEILQGSKGGGPVQYRQYSKWYFRELARRAAEAGLVKESKDNKEGGK